MSTTVLYMSMSLDGFVAGSNEGSDMASATGDTASVFTCNAGTPLGGMRRPCDLFGLSSFGAVRSG